MEYQIGNKGIFELRLVNDYVYEAPSFDGYSGFNFAHMYIFEDETGQEFIWKTANSRFVLEDKDRADFCGYNGLVLIKGTIKDITEYQGREQVVLTRCAVGSIIETGMTYAEYEQYKKEQQVKSVTNADKILTVTYAEYKEKYSDYETIINSFRRTPEGCFIDIIIRG